MLNCDVVIVGAGLLGSGTAMHLANISSLSIAVVDLDLTGVYSSSELNAGGVRATWNHPVNAVLSRVSIDYYETVAEQIGFLQRGYFWMFEKEAWPDARKILQSNPHLKGLHIGYLSASDITKRFSFIDKVDDLGGATFSPKDGLLNPNLLKQHYREKARDKGVSFHNRIWVHGVQLLEENKLELEAWFWPEGISDDELRAVLMGVRKDIAEGRRPQGAQELKIRAKNLVNCSGAWARRFAQCMNIICPSQPLRRQVSLFECREVDIRDCGMFVDSSGVYFHPEGENILGGYATPDEIPGYNLEYDGERFFQDHIWPALFNRSSKFENLKHLTGWAGLYEISPDKSAIVGKVSGMKNVFEAHSFSGRGAMQSYGASLGLAELIAKGRFDTLDLNDLNGARFAQGRLVSEGLLI